MPTAPESIVEAALPLFARAGYAGTSMRQIASVAGTTASALYRVFPGKLALFEAVVESQLKSLDVEADLRPLAEHSDVQDVLEGVSFHLLGTVQARPALLRLLVLTTLGEDPVAAKLTQAFRRPYVEFVEAELVRRIKSKDLLPVDPAITARCYVGMVLSCALNSECWNPMEGVEFNMRDVVRNNVSIFARGLKGAKRENLRGYEHVAL